MSKQTIPENFNPETLPPDTPGHRYDNHMTRDLDPDRLAQAKGPHAVVESKLGTGFWIGLFVFLLILAAIVVYGIHARSDFAQLRR